LDKGGHNQNKSQQQDWCEKPRRKEITEIPEQGSHGLQDDTDEHQGQEGAGESEQ
jgi:hypothetical protein